LLRVIKVTETLKEEGDRIELIGEEDIIKKETIYYKIRIRISLTKTRSLLKEKKTVITIENQATRQENAEALRKTSDL